MAQLSLGEAKWRMVRRAVARKRFAFADVRDMTRHDRKHFEWLVENGFFVPAGDSLYELTERGRSAADLGFYEYEPAPRPAAAAGPPKAARGKRG
jgi:hypothetical protein